PAATVDSIRFNPFERGEAFLVQFGNIYRTVDGGESWKPFSNDGLEGAGVGMLWFSPHLPGRIFALTSARGALIFDLPQADAAKPGDHASSSGSN
ncbi:MAG: hypothetical protein JOZ32_10350, partial [Bryobacterales bacterium]|nr:hypothetical protein [Bryobacterales bacterium]